MPHPKKFKGTIEGTIEEIETQQEEEKIETQPEEEKIEEIPLEETKITPEPAEEQPPEQAEESKVEQPQI